MSERKRPFPTFVIWLLVFVLSLLAILVRCSAGLFDKEPPSITITAEGTQLNWVVEKDVWNGTVYEHPDIFYCYGRNVEFPSQASAGETVSIKMGGTVPDQVTLTEFALSANEQSIYGNRELLEEYIFYFEGTTGTFTLPQPEDNPVRGYLLRCTWGGIICEYGFVVQIVLE